ncbi:MAG: 4-(cytidine 5'-diphospho)-2-C-methyl-D-erythritol kinase [Candidatus Eisenbacteria bacterium]
MESLRVHCNAKVNLYLRILGKRDDGYHDIETVYHSISLHDTLTLKRADSGFSISSDHPDVPLDMSNLALKAAARVLEGSSHGVSLTLEKRIPIGAGLGGGSADAAGALVGTDRLFETDCSREELEAMAEELGQDVKFMLRGGCAQGKGRGDELSPLPCLPALSLVLVIPPVTVQTGWAYDSFKTGLTREGTDLTMIASALEKGDVTSLCKLLHNDFESLIFDRFPFLREVKQELLRSGAEGVLMSGSGPVIYGIYAKAGDAELFKERFGSSGLITVITEFAGRGVTDPM